LRGPAALLLSLWLACSLAHAGAAPTPPPSPALSKELQNYLAKPEADLDLATGALLICKEEYPALDIAAPLKALDALGAKLSEGLPKAGTPREKLALLRALLFDTEQFGLPKKDDAAAFLLSDVLANKRGNCLGLSILALSVAERGGLKLFGVPIPSRLSGPGHLLVRFDDGGVRVNFDATERGAEHDDAYYEKLFKLRPEDRKDGYILGNATRRDVLSLLLINLGGARVEAGRPADALPLLEAALKLKPTYAQTQVNLAAAKYALGDFADAEQAYAQAMKLDKDNSAAHAGAAEVALRRGDLDKAEAEAETAEALDPESVNSRVIQANVKLARGQFRGAISLLREICDAAPKDERLRGHLGTALRLGGEFAEAEQVFKQALELDPKSADAHYGLAETLRATGQTQESNAEYAQALMCEPKHAPTRLAQARIAESLNDQKTAQAAYEALLKDQPANAEALAALAKLFIQQKKLREAKDLISAALKAEPGNFGLALLRAETFMNSGDLSGAQTQFQEMLPKATDAEKIIVLQRVAICYGKQGNHLKALETAEKILKDRPADLTALRLAAAACEGLHESAKATLHYKKILELDPTDTAAKAALTRLGVKQ